MFGRQARLPIDLVYGTKVEQTPVSEYAATTKHALEEAYCLVRKKLDTAHCLQKTLQLYNKKVHGRSFAVGDLVWLFSPAVPRGHSKKLYHPWSGPHRITAKLSESDYQIKKLVGKRKIQVVHFDRLKLCDPGMRFNDMTLVSSSSPPPAPSGPELFGQDMEPCDTDNSELPPLSLAAPSHADVRPLTTPRYPTQHRTHPDRYGNYITH